MINHVSRNIFITESSLFKSNTQIDIVWYYHTYQQWIWLVQALYLGAEWTVIRSRKLQRLHWRGSDEMYDLVTDGGMRRCGSDQICDLVTGAEERAD